MFELKSEVVPPAPADAHIVVTFTTDRRTAARIAKVIDHKIDWAGEGLSDEFGAIYNALTSYE